VDLAYTTESPRLPDTEGPVALRILGASRGRGKGYPGFFMQCTAGTNWKGRVIQSGLVSSLDLAPCAGENRSIVWDAKFDLRSEATFHITLESDDGSGVFIDDVLVVDNDLENTHGPQRKDGQAKLGPGTHTIRVKFFNGPADEKLIVTLDDGHGPKAVSVAAFLDRFYFYVDPLPGAVR